MTKTCHWCVADEDQFAGHWYFGGHVFCSGDCAQSWKTASVAVH